MCLNRLRTPTAVWPSKLRGFGRCTRAPPFRDGAVGSDGNQNQRDGNDSRPLSTQRSRTHEESEGVLCRGEEGDATRKVAGVCTLVEQKTARKVPVERQSSSGEYRGDAIVSDWR